MARSADWSWNPTAMIDERPRTLAETFCLRLIKEIGSLSELRTRCSTTVLVAIDGRSTMLTEGSRAPLSATSTTWATPAKLLGTSPRNEYISARPTASTDQTKIERRLRVLKKRCGVIVCRS